MPAPATAAEFLDLVRKSGVLDKDALEDYLAQRRSNGSPVPENVEGIAAALVEGGLLTQFQANLLRRGKWKGLIINGKYKLLDLLGSGGMGNVFLCEHTAMRRRVALKVLPASQVNDPGALERFYREARAVATLDHPNIVRAHDIDHEDKLHFLVMEYVDGASLQAVVARHGPLELDRATNYIYQAALGLQQAYQMGLVHRDIKPGNILVDRQGVVKILDLGLARFFHDSDDSLTSKYDDKSVLGTADYFAPEQAVNSHDVDIRADIYSLGCTFYFLLTGSSPFGSGTVAQKIIWHQIRSPRPLHEIREDVPEEIEAIIGKMMAKDPGQRYQTPAELAEALLPWVQTPVAPPPSAEMPALRLGSEGLLATPLPPPLGPASPARIRTTAESPSSTRTTTRTPPRNSPLDPEATAIRQGPFTPAPRTVKARRMSPLLLLLPVLALLVAVPTAALLAGWAFLAHSSRPNGVLSGPRAEVTAREPEAPVPSVTPVTPSVTIRPIKDGYRVQGAKYDAIVGTDGNLTSLRVGGLEFLKSGVKFGDNISRGSYFYSDKEGNTGVVSLSDIDQPASNVLAARGDKFSVRYEFGPDSLSMRVTDATDYAAPFYLVFDPATVTEVRNGAGETLPVPVQREQQDPVEPKWQTTTWMAGNSRLKVEGGTKIWGPWMEGHYQVWEASLGSYETRDVQLQMDVVAAGTETPAPTPAPLPSDGVLVTEEQGGYQVQTPGYEALIASDGCMTSLRVEGVEFVKPGVDISRGVYFHHGPSGGTLALKTLAHPDKNVVTAQSDKAAIRYEFARDSMTWTAENKLKDGMSFFIVLDATVKAVRNDKGEWAKVPVKKDWQEMTWFAGAVKLAISGGSRVWGPWPGNGPPDRYQVWEASLGPNEKRQIVLKPGRASDEELAQEEKVTGTKPAPPPDVVLQSPLDYQVFQRRTRDQGAVKVRGRVKPECDRVQVRLTGKSLQGELPGEWQEVPLEQQAHTFAGEVPVAAGGWYRMELQALKGQDVVARATVEHVGVGEVFVMAGQSNSTNCGQFRIQQHSDMVSSFSGSDWKLADDPQPGVHDNSTGGSPWPAFGDAMYAKYHVPIGIASTGHSGTSVRQWEPGGELFRWMLTRLKQLGPQGFRAVLWHQGESDVGMPTDEYLQRMSDLIKASKAQAGWDFPWFVAHVSYHNPTETSFPNVRAAQQKLWDNGVALEGPDTDKLTGDNRDNEGKGIHFSPKGLKAHGEMWADKVSAWLDTVLKENK